MVTSLKTNNQEHTNLGIKQQADLGKKPRIFFKICKKASNFYILPCQN